MTEAQTLAFPGRREDDRKIEPALADALAHAGAGIVRGNTLTARVVLEEALELVQEPEPSGWTVVFADGDPRASGQLVLIVREDDRVRLSVARGDPRETGDFLLRERAGFDTTTIAAEIGRRFGPSACTLTTTRRVLRLWRGSESEPGA